MKYGENNKMWFAWYFDEKKYPTQYQQLLPLYESLIHFTTMDQAITFLSERGFHHIYDEHTPGSGGEKYYANENLVANIYMFHRRQLTVNFKVHDAKSATALKKRYNFFNHLSTLSPEEWQA